MAVGRLLASRAGTIQAARLPPEGIAVIVEEFDKQGVLYEKSGVKSPPSRSTTVMPSNRRSAGGPLEVGEDIISFEIGDTVTVHHFKP